MTANYDVVIVGGGVAGSSLGGLLAKDGLGVLIVERERRFRDRVRGEALHPWGVAEINRLGLGHVLMDAGSHELPIWQRYSDQQPEEPFRWADVSIDGLPEISVSHPRLQTTSLTWALSQGAEVIRPARAIGLRPGPEVSISVDGTAKEFNARFVVGADGRRSAVRRWIGSKTIVDDVHHRVGGALFDRTDLSFEASHEAPFPGGRVFVLPQGSGRARAYYVSSAARLAESRAHKTAAGFIEACKPIMPGGSLDRAIPAGPVAFFPNSDIWTNEIVAQDTALIGDAAGANDPSVGQGLSIAYRDVRELREALANSRSVQSALKSYEERRRPYYDVIRQHAYWLGILTTEEGREADARRERVARAREIDPSAGGFSLIFARGPEGLVANESARRHFFGEDLD